MKNLKLEIIIGILYCFFLSSCLSDWKNNSPENVYPHLGENVKLKAYNIYRDSVLSTFSFEYGTQDIVDPNDFGDIEYGRLGTNGEKDLIRIDLTKDDIGGILDTDTIDYDLLSKIDLSLIKNKCVEAKEGHYYIVYSKDNDTDLYARFFISEMKSNDWILIDWVRSRNGKDFIFPKSPYGTE